MFVVPESYIGKKVLVRQNRSLIGRSRDFRRALAALGLGRIGSERELSVNPSVLGMLNRVKHVIEVKEI